MKQSDLNNSDNSHKSCIATQLQHLYTAYKRLFSNFKVKLLTTYGIVLILYMVSIHFM